MCLRRNLTKLFALVALVMVFPQVLIAGSLALLSDAECPRVAPESLSSTFNTSSREIVVGVNGVRAYVLDSKTKQVLRLNQGSMGSTGYYGSLSFSSDMKFAAFDSTSKDLLPSATSGLSEVYLRDYTGGATTLVSLGYDGKHSDMGSYWPMISEDGKYVCFYSCSTNLIQSDKPSKYGHLVYLYDSVGKTTSCISLTCNGEIPNGDCTEASMTPDARYVVFVGSGSNMIDNAGRRDIYLFERIPKTTKRIIEPYDGVMEPDSCCFRPKISADGNYIVFMSQKMHLVPNDNNEKNDIFRYDRKLHKTILISCASDGTEANNNSENCWVTREGRFVFFVSNASNLVPENTDGSNLFIHDCISGKTELVFDEDIREKMKDKPAQYISITQDGQCVLFYTEASLVTEDTNEKLDSYLYWR